MTASRTTIETSLAGRRESRADGSFLPPKSRNDPNMKNSLLGPPQWVEQSPRIVPRGHHTNNWSIDQPKPHRVQTFNPPRGGRPSRLSAG